MINLDPKREDTRRDINLEHLTRRTIRALEEKLHRQLPFVATIHNADHSPLRHMHGFFLLRGRLTRQEFSALRRMAWTTATAEARRQRRLLDLVRHNPRLSFLTHTRASIRAHGLSRPAHPRPRRGVKPLLLQGGCRHCGYGQLSGIPKWYTWCPSCHKPLKRERPFRLGREVSG